MKIKYNIKNKIIKFKMKKKIYNLKELSKIISVLKKENKIISLCHGVFDLLHPGHIYHFDEAKKKSDILIVSVTSDEKVLKGPGKPYFDKEMRMHSLASLEVVDFIVSSDDKSSVNIIKKIKPNYYVKGTDYKNLKNDITGKINLEKNEVKKHGGDILFTNGPVFSSSQIINREFFYNKEQNAFINKLKNKYSIKTILNSIDKLANNIPLVFGETIIDEYVFCKAIGKSGKESYMVMQEKNSEEYLGGVLSIAQNLAAVSKKVNLLTTLGMINSYKKKITRELKKNINLKFFLKKNSQTIIKKRFIEEIDNIKLLGLYSISDQKYSPKEENLLIKKFKMLVKNSDLIILSDYGHGFFTDNLRKEIYKVNKFKAINAQVNAFNTGYHTITNYKKADLVLMNETELRHELRDKNSNRSNLIKKIEKIIKCKFIAITHGKTGATIYSTKSKETVHVPAFARQVVDKVGAGDALFPILATCLKSEIPMDISLYIASISAAINAEGFASKSVLDESYFKKFLDHSIK